MTFRTNMYDWVVGSTATKLISGETIEEAVENEKGNLACYGYNRQNKEYSFLSLENYEIEKNERKAKNISGQEVVSVDYKITFYVKAKHRDSQEVVDDIYVLYANLF